MSRLLELFMDGSEACDAAVERDCPVSGVDCEAGEVIVAFPSRQIKTKMKIERSKAVHIRMAYASGTKAIHPSQTL